MNYLEAESICKYLKSKEIQLSPNNEWLRSCTNWYKSHLELGSVYGSLQDFVCVQWLLADLRNVKHASLPTICKEAKTELTGNYAVQVNWMRDIGQSCYSQLKAVQLTNASDCNDNVSADEQKKQSWEPNPKRVLMIELTDGVTTLKAMEYSPITQLYEPFLPGFKAVLSGPIECRRGILFLRNNNIKLLGGEVDHLFEIHSKENLLSRCLNITTESNNFSQPRDVGGTVSSTSNSQNSLLIDRSRLFNDLAELPDSTSNIELNDLADGREMLMTDEDDEFLCQLPDEVLDPQNVDPQPILSPVLNNRQMNQSAQGSEYRISDDRSPTVDCELPTLNKPKLFHIGKDLIQSRTEILPTRDREQPPIKPTKTHFKPPETGKQFGSTLSLNDSYISNIVENQLLVQPKNAQKETESPRETSICMIDKEIAYPKFEKLVVRVNSITKLKIRNGEWQCSATVFIESQVSNVTFNNEVLKKLFRISAAEIEVWRGEMATNPSLKKKVNDILKAGQTKLKTLNCPMTLEYSSEDCTPQIVMLH